MDERLSGLGALVRETAAQATTFAANAAWLIGSGAKKLTDAARVRLRIADLHAEINAQLRTLGELLYATHTGNPTDSEVLLEHMEKIDALKAQLAALTGGESEVPGAEAPIAAAAESAEAPDGGAEGEV